MIALPERRGWPRIFRADGVLRRMVANTAILVAGRGANAVFTLGYLALAARSLGIETLGVLILIHTYTQTVSALAKLRSWEALLRFGAPALRDQRIDDFRSLIGFTARLDIFSAVGSTAIAVAGIALASNMFGWQPETGRLASLYCLSVLVAAPAAPIGLLRLFDRFDLLAAQSALASLIRLVGAATLTLVGGGLAAFLGLWFIATACASAALVAFAWRELRRRNLRSCMSGSLRCNAVPFAGIWRFVWTTNLTSSVATLTTHVPTLVVGGLLGAGDAALFRIARELAEALAKPTKLLIPTIFPELARLAAHDARDAMRDLVRKSMILSGVGAFLCFIVLWLAGELLLRLILGDDAVPAYGVMLLLGAASLIALWAFPLEPLLISVGYEGAALRARLGAALVYVLLMAALIAQAGLIGSGIAAVAASLLMVAAQLSSCLRWMGGGPTSRNVAEMTPGLGQDIGRHGLAHGHPK